MVFHIHSLIHFIHPVSQWLYSPIISSCNNNMRLGIEGALFCIVMSWLSLLNRTTWVRQSNLHSWNTTEKRKERKNIDLRRTIKLIYHGTETFFLFDYFIFFFCYFFFHHSFSQLMYLPKYKLLKRWWWKNFVQTCH